MKKPLTLIALLLWSNAIYATPSKKEKETFINVKCHVELVGGKQTIHFASISQKQRSKFETKLAGNKVDVTFSRTKQTIYKVFECVGHTKEFTKAPSKWVDEKTAR